jgi:hypothetical protein
VTSALLEKKEQNNSRRARRTPPGGCTAPGSTNIFRMGRAIISILLVAAAAGPISAHSQQVPATRQKTARDARGPACAQILQMSSSDWVAKAAGQGNSATDVALRAIASYGRCYDARTDRLAAALARTPKGPSRTALADFREFEAALKEFTAEALAATAPPGDALNSAYAALYEKQFRYAFYQSYERKTPNPQPPAAPSPSASKTTATSTQTSASASPAPAANPQASADAEPLTKAKNHFGELLDALPDGKMHELHAAFGKVVGRHAVTNETRLAVYRYAIFLLEPPAAEPFAPPPF